MSKSKRKPLRFAALIRVSTERQKNRQSSLDTQQEQLSSAVESLGGMITAEYSGQEHATAGYERELVNKMLDDAEKKRKKFDAIIVQDPSRWSRDNIQSETGLERLRGANVKFFVLNKEYDLFNPTDQFLLSISTTVGAYQAHIQTWKATHTQLNNAKKGIPTTGARPYGRIYIPSKEKNQAEAGIWKVDKEKQKQLENVARRFLNGESLPKLAKEIGMDYSNLHRTLRDKCGSGWSARFNVKRLDIDTTINFPEVPSLLPENTIKALKKKFEANRTYAKKVPTKHQYLLAGHIFCEGCGCLLTGEYKEGNMYYRHNRKQSCPVRPRPHVRADQIENSVLELLFKSLGNPAEIERAIQAAIPNKDKVEKSQKRVDKINSELSRLKTGRNKILDKIERELISDEDADSKLIEMRNRQAHLVNELEELQESLSNIPKLGQAPSLFVLEDDNEEYGKLILLVDDEGNQYSGGNDLMSWLDLMKKGSYEDRRKLMEVAFGGGVGKAGVFIDPHPLGNTRPKRWNFSIRGFLGTTSISP